MSIRDIVGLWCDDITFCQAECELKDCPRNKKNIRDRTVPHSFSVEIPSDCLKKHEEGKARVKAAIYLDVPEWQIGKDVSVYFPDTMLKRGKCERLEEQEPISPTPAYLNIYKAAGFYHCGKCHAIIVENQKYCHDCGQAVKWK